MYFAHHSSCLYIILELLVWCIAIVCQVIAFTLWVAHVPFVIIFQIFWFFVGVWLELTKTITCGSIYLAWIRIWTGCVVICEKPNIIDCKSLNVLKFHEFCYESLPQITIQITNNILMHNLAFSGFLSSFVSLFLVVDGLYKFVYFQYFASSDMHKNIADMPVGSQISIPLKWLGYEDYNIMNTQLPDDKLKYTVVYINKLNAGVIASAVKYAEIESGGPSTSDSLELTEVVPEVTMLGVDADNSGGFIPPKRFESVKEFQANTLYKPLRSIFRTDAAVTLIMDKLETIGVVDLHDLLSIPSENMSLDYLTKKAALQHAQAVKILKIYNDAKQ